MNARQRLGVLAAGAMTLYLSLAAAGGGQEDKAPKFDPASAKRSLDWFIKAVGDYETAVASGNDLKIEAAKKAVEKAVARGTELVWEVRVGTISRDTGVNFLAEWAVKSRERYQHFTIDLRTGGGFPLPAFAKDIDRGQLVTIRARVNACEVDFSRANPRLHITIAFPPTVTPAPKKGG